MSPAPPRPTARPEITRPATRAHLPALLAFLDRAVAEGGVGDDVLFPLHLAVEEACANVIAHGYAGGAGPLTLGVEVGPGAVAVTLTDEARPFDPASAPLPPSGPADERPVGGLGWHLIRETTDEVRHEAVPGGGNRLTLVKHRPPPRTP
ncbi:ATP-binding protein [Rubrivirga sp.]|uniref:ATP-binding protein n=1 Tax=Rubrivirga sp. TaxID=1885344 RepID=UPI003B52BC0B